MKKGNNSIGLRETGGLHFAFEVSLEMLIDYELGKLTLAQQKQVEKYLEANPEERFTLEGIRQYHYENKLHLLTNPPAIQETEIHKLQQLIQNEVKPEQNSWTRGSIEFITRLNTQLQRCKSLEEAYAIICDTVRQYLSCRTASIFMYNTEGHLERKHISGFDTGKEPDKEVFKIGQGFVGKAVGSRKQYGSPFRENRLQALVQREGDPILQKYLLQLEDAISQQNGIKEKVNHLIVVPLDSFKRSAGVLRVLNKFDPVTNNIIEEGFTAEDQDTLSVIAAVSITTISFLKLQERKRILNNIPKISRQLGTEQILNLIAKSLINEKATLYHLCNIRIVDKKAQRLVVKGSSENYLDPKIRKIKVQEGITGITYYSDKHIIVSDLREETTSFLHRDWALSNGLITMICFPLKSANSSMRYGTLSIYSKFKFEFGDENLEYLEDFADQVSRLIESIQDELEQKFIKEFSEKLIYGKDLEQVMFECIRKLPSVIGFDRCRIFLKESNRYRFLRQAESRRLPDIPSDNWITQYLEKHPHEWITLSDVPRDKRLEELRPYLEDIKAMVVVPIIDSHNRLLGVIVLASLISQQVHVKDDRQRKVIENLLSNLNRDLLLTVSNLCSVSIEKQQEREKKEIMAHLLRTVVDRVPDLIYVKDLEHRFVLINKGQARMLNVEQIDHAIGNTDFDYFDPVAAKEFQEKEEKVYAQGGGTINVIEEVYDKKEDRKKIYYTTKTTYNDSQDRIKGLIGIGRDITALKDAEKLLKETINDLKLANEHANKQIVDLLTQRLIKEAKPGSEEYMTGRLSQAEAFMKIDLADKTHDDDLLQKRKLFKTKAHLVMDQRFEEFIKVMPSALGEKAFVEIVIDSSQEFYCISKMHVQDIILSLMQNALEHTGTGVTTYINIEAKNGHLFIKNTCFKRPRDINRLKNILSIPEYRDEASTLYRIAKYFRDNYQKDINIGYRDDQFIVGLPILVVAN